MIKMDKKELQRIISLTFDESPIVRKDAALKLAKTEEPGAVFALFELSYDKDESVKAAARDILSKKKPSDKDSISFADIFGKPEAPEHVIEPSEWAEDESKKKRMLSPIERIFEKKFGKTKAAMVKDKMMPTIEKVYKKAVESGTENIEKREKSMQKMITSYVDALQGLDKLMFDERKVVEQKQAKIQSMGEIPHPEPQEEDGVLEEVGTGAGAEKIHKEVAELEAEPDGEEEPETAVSVHLPEPESGNAPDKSIFRKAYDVMMASDGDDEVMFQQSQKLIKQVEDEVALAFRLAKQKFKSDNITHLTELKDGMRSVSTDVLVVKGTETGEYLRTKTKKDTYTRITANDDEGSEGIIYLFEGRGREVQAGMKIKVVKGQVKTFSFSGETALTVNKRGSVYIVV